MSIRDYLSQNESLIYEDFMQKMKKELLETPIKQIITAHLAICVNMKAWIIKEKYMNFYIFDTIFIPYLKPEICWNTLEFLLRINIEFASDYLVVFYNIFIKVFKQSFNEIISVTCTYFDFNDFEKNDLFQKVIRKIYIIGIKKIVVFLLFYTFYIFLKVK